MTEPRRLTDPRDLRALAHPLRLAILEALNLEGPMTASALGERLGESPSNCSWHLRKLAEHGFVVEAEGGRGRQRPWKAAQRGLQWDEGAESTEAALAGQTLSQMLLDREVRRLMQALAHRAEEPEGWREVATLSQSMMWLTAEELTEVNARLTALMLDKIERNGDPALRPAGARLCAFVAWGVPVPPPGPAPASGLE